MKNTFSDYKSLPWFTLSIIAINCVVFLLMAMEAGITNQFDALFALSWGASFNPYVLDGESWRLFVAMFLHFHLLHLAFNMFAFYKIGVDLEIEMGWLQLMSLYLLSGLAGCLASVYFNLFAISAGASGAIFGLYGFYFALVIKHSFTKGTKPGKHVLDFAIFLGINLLLGSFLNADMPGHLGGLACGIVLALFYREVENGKLFKFAILGMFLLLPMLFFLLPKNQLQYYNAFQAVIATEQHSNAVLANSSNDSELREEMEQSILQWDSSLNLLQSVSAVPPKLRNDTAELSKYIKHRRMLTFYRLKAIESQSFVFIDSLNALNDSSQSPSLKYPLVMNRTKSENNSPDEGNAISMEPEKAYYDSSWNETTEENYIYYRIGYKDSLGRWTGSIKDFYADGKIQMKGTFVAGLKDGLFTYYSKTGKYEASGKYAKELKIYEWEYFHPNGKSARKIRYDNEYILTNSWDTLGKAMVVNGEGEDIEYHPNGKILERGFYKQGKREGNWAGFYEDGTPYYKEFYANGDFKQGIATGKDKSTFKYDLYSHYPSPVGGMDAFYAFCQKEMRYPYDAKQKGIEGRLRMIFEVDKTGRIENIRFLDQLGFGCEDEAKRLLLNGPKWIPGRLHGFELTKTEGVAVIEFKLPIGKGAGT